MVKLTLPNGKQVEGEQVEIEKSQEYWNEYILSDGNILRFKTVVTEIYQYEGIDPVSGVPNYLVRSNNVVSIKQTK
jgi:hypothetical protein